MKEKDKIWTKKKIAFLKDNFTTMALPKLSEELGISVYFVRKKATELGYILKKSSSTWTDEEIRILKEYYPIIGTECIEYLPNRTEFAIRMAASLYKIKSNYNCGKWSDEELEILKNNYPKIGPKCVDLLPNRTLKTIQTKASILGIKYKKARKIETLWSDEELEILQKYYPIMGSKCIEKFPDRFDTNGNKLPKRTSGSVIAMAYRLNAEKTYNWTEEEIEILKTEYPILGYGCKKDLPYKSKRCIQIKAKDLKLKKDESHDQWSDKEIKMLMDAYPKMGKKCIDLFPNRTSDAILAKAARLNLKTNRKEDSE